MLASVRTPRARRPGMRTPLASTAALLLVLPLSAAAQNAALTDVAAALGAAGLKSLEYSGSGVHHFDHSGGLRAFAGEGITVITHEISRAYIEKTLAAPATLKPDHLAKSGRKPVVEGVRDRRVLTDGARTVEIHHIAGNAHADGLLMVYLPKEKLLSEADVYTPPAANTPPAMPPSPFTLNFVDNLKRLGLN